MIPTQTAFSVSPDGATLKIFLAGKLVGGAVISDPSPTPAQSSYLRPGGVFTYLRPGGTSVYLRPNP